MFSVHCVQMLHRCRFWYIITGGSKILVEFWFRGLGRNLHVPGFVCSDRLVAHRLELQSVVTLSRRPSWTEWAVSSDGSLVLDEKYAKRFVEVSADMERIKNKYVRRAIGMTAGLFVS